MGTTDDNLELSLRVEWLEEQVRLIKDRYTILTDSANKFARNDDKICEMGNDVGCDFCNEENEGFDYNYGIHSMSDGDIQLCWQTYEWNDSADGFNHIHFPVSYCPMCGRKLRGV